MKMKNFFVLSIAVIFLSVGFTTPLITQECIGYAFYGQRDNKLYLYFPTTADSSFPEYGSPYGVNTSPLQIFDVADLDSSIGSTADLRQKIFEVVTEDYCEFNVGVSMTTAAPTPIESNWQIVGIGSDSGGVLAGIAQAVDINDSAPQDYARVFAGSFEAAYTGPGGALAGTNSTLDRWANAIGSTTTHEAAHNYGVGHADAYPVSSSGEDGVNNHIEATASSGLTGEMRAGVDRHFSDTEYEILGHNVGLHVNTVHNWDFTNPNNVDAYGMKLKVLSTSSTLTISWCYTGNRSPWTNPTVTSTSTTEVFHGTTYNVYNVSYTAGQVWINGPSGQVPPAEEFHLGASFSESSAVIVKETALLDSSLVNTLPLAPRMVGYDAGALDLVSGDLVFQVFNPNPARGDLFLRDISVQLVPRMIDINTMVVGARPVGLHGFPINVISSCIKFGKIKIEDDTKIRVANLTDKRHVDLTYTKKGCKQGHRKGGASDSLVGEVIYCPDGTALSLFPSTYVYITATVVDPNARYWDPKSNQFIIGPRESRLFYQFSGIVPDTNKNGRDDLLDIRIGASRDKNENGVPDEAEKLPEENGKDRQTFLSLHFGTAVPTGGLADFYKAGFNAAVDIEVPLKKPFSLRGILGYNQFKAKTDLPNLDDTSIVNANLNLRYSTSGKLLTLFTEAGPGYYFIKDADNKMGVNVGGGFHFNLSERTRLEFAAHYNIIFTKEKKENTYFFHLGGGLLIRL